MGGPIKTMVDKNVIAVGDAAGLVMPSNGGGISQAMISGCFAAEAWLEHKCNSTPLKSYQERIHACFGRALKNSLRSKNMGYLHVSKRHHNGSPIDEYWGPLEALSEPWNAINRFGSSKVTIVLNFIGVFKSYRC